MPLKHQTFSSPTTTLLSSLLSDCEPSQTYIFLDSDSSRKKSPHSWCQSETKAVMHLLHSCARVVSVISSLSTRHFTHISRQRWSSVNPRRIVWLRGFGKYLISLKATTHSAAAFIWTRINTLSNNKCHQVNLFGFVHFNSISIIPSMQLEILGELLG